MYKILGVFSLVFAVFALAMLPVEEAEAKRFGFGKSFGKQYNQSRMKQPSKSTTTTSKQTATNNATGGAARTSGASRWLGPLAGLAAGGLLASLFFGDAFEGIQPMDILLILGLVFGGMMLLRAMGRRAAQPQAAGAAGMNPQFRGDASMDHGSDARFQDEMAGGAEEVMSVEAPAWFNTETFSQGAKTHFIRLQAAWDKGDLKDIAEYTTPELYSEIQAERLSRGEERHFTEVVTLYADVVSVQREAGQVVATVHFSGLIREEQGAQPSEFAELWHVTHDWDNPEGDWHIAGIQQI
ncbi:MAG: TIM44-like domain-containing protein [Sedimenticola sp.]